MGLGQRLKQARLEAGLSQRQLCGETITRNMLSQIENGSARPSMGTLEYLSRRLGKPISFFLEEETVTSPNQVLMTQAREAFSLGKYAEVIRILEDYRSPDAVFDPERFLLEALALTALSKEAAAAGKGIYAGELLEKAGKVGEQTPYYTRALERERLLTLYRVRPELARELAEELPRDHRESLLRGRACLDAGDFSGCLGYLAAVPPEDREGCLLRGQAALGQKDYPRAIRELTRVETVFPRVCLGLLEQCYRELGDFQNAYLYACKQREN